MLCKTKGEKGEGGEGGEVREGEEGEDERGVWVQPRYWWGKTRKEKKRQISRETAICAFLGEAGRTNSNGQWEGML